MVVLGVILCAGLALSATAGAEHTPHDYGREAKLVPGDPQENVQTLASTIAPGDVGHAVDVDGDTAIVGDPRNTNELGYTAGAAFIFERGDDGSWEQRARLLASHGSKIDYFGRDVAIDGDTAIVGSPLEDTGGVTRPGSVYVFTKQGHGGWGQEARLVVADAPSFLELGASVDLDGDQLIAGSRQAGESRADGAYVFARGEGGTWRQEARLAGSQEGVRGYDVAIDDETALVAAPHHENGDGADAGSVWVFSPDETGSWSEEDQLLAADGDRNDLFGGSVAIEDRTAIVGAAKATNAEPNRTGAVYVFEATGQGWQQDAKLTPHDGEPGDAFGSAVTLEDQRLLVGAEDERNANGPSAGSAYLYERHDASDEDGWRHEGKIVAWDGDARDSFGHDVALDGDVLLVGAPDEGNRRGDRQGSAIVFSSMPTPVPIGHHVPPPEAEHRHDLGPRLNAPPTAIASDRVLVDEDGDGQETVRLVDRFSYDPDGQRDNGRDLGCQLGGSVGNNPPIAQRRWRNTTGEPSPDVAWETSTLSYGYRTDPLTWGTGSWDVSLEVTDRCGAEHDTRFTVHVVPETATLLETGFEESLSDRWSTSGLWQVTGSCQIPQLDGAMLGFTDPGTSALRPGADGGCSYDSPHPDDHRGAAELRIDLTDQHEDRWQTLVLSFDHRFDVGDASPFLLSEHPPARHPLAFPSNAAQQDVMRVQTSYDGGETWQTLERWDVETLPHAQGSYSFTLTPGERTVPDDELLVRWHFDTHGPHDNENKGWFVDDVSVRGVP